MMEIKEKNMEMKSGGKKRKNGKQRMKRKRRFLEHWIGWTLWMMDREEE